MSVDVGQILLESGRIASRHLEQARDHAASHDCGVEEALLELQLVTEDDLAHALGGHFDIPGFSLARLPKPDPKVTALVPEPITDYSVRPGIYRITVEKEGMAVVERQLYVADGQVLEVRVP